ncbi:NAD(P)-binding protein [Laetiporus sulphureus 93-53]|uniref:NAD(P)-binding protein n=1 Tax=Laetiporus sulphureus 93-53 TaxID=1314785 RepID=A0A165DZ37_9APHY|nr:NAD(P)-binding protein [Laetiporus sulphureus 93-53]KZT05929.1 NAD(P)-binding protein [Laetiporus sulphureus 93-53]
MTILITGAAGRTSGYVIKALLESPNVSAPDLRLLVRSESAIEKVHARFPQLPPRPSFVIADFLEASTLPAAVQGVDVVFHNAPTFHPQETAMGIAMIDAAKEAGVKHFVYCSVLFPILTKLVNHIVKCHVEEYLIESGLNYTILEPTALMQNIDLERVQSTFKIYSWNGPDILEGYLDLEDLAAVARIVLLDPKTHNRARYELCGQNCSYADIAHEASAQLGRPIECEQVPREQIIAQGIKTSMLRGDYAIDAADRMLYYYEKRGIPGNNNVLRWLLGREPTTWTALLRRELKSS